MPKKQKDKSGAQLTHRGAGAVRKALGGAQKRVKKVPGPSTNPATNILIADVGLRAGNLLIRRTMEKGLLRLRYPPEKAHQMIEGRTLGKTLITAGLARLATRSIPGALLVTGGLLAKAVFDRTLSRRESERRGDEELDEQADNAE